jgi:8-oxo-dGTP pyrophosphatase MutT (NUDIX family)
MNIDPRLPEIDSSLYRVAVKAVIRKDNKVLLGLENRGHWGFPGGGIDYGDDLEAALIRELSEELGVKSTDILSEFKIGCITSGQIHDGIPKLNIFIKIELSNEEFILEEEIKKVSWYTADELRKLKFSPSNGDIETIISTFLS